MNHSAGDLWFVSAFTFSFTLTHKTLQLELVTNVYGPHGHVPATIPINNLSTQPKELINSLMLDILAIDL